MMRDSLRPIFATIQDGTIVKFACAALYLLLKRLVDSLAGGNIGMIVLLVLFDLVTGVAAALKKKKRVSSNLWYKTPLKMGNYCILVSLGHMTGDMYLLSWLAPVLTVLIVTTEILSIIENISVTNPRLIPKYIARRIGALKTDRYFEQPPDRRKNDRT